MKTTLLFSTILLASITACYKDEAVLNEIPQDPLTKAQDYLSGNERVKMKRHKITENRAMQIAQEAKGLFSDETERMIKGRSVSTVLNPVVVTRQSKARSAGGIDTLMFIVNYSNNDGFVFVSNDDRDGEILMYSGNGSFAMQDTAGNPGLKLHVEMMIAYQEHKLSEMKAAEARGEEYVGAMTSEEVSDEEMPNLLSATRGAIGMPGMPGHTCNISGMPGSHLREDICAPATYESKDWSGSESAIALAKKKYRNEKCFGVPVAPPSVKFTTIGVPGVGGSHQNCFPYCSPHISDYDGYYNYYGCKMEMKIRTQRDVDITQIQPLLTTYWDQDAPLNHGDNFAGCGPIAMVQIMLYHAYPKTYVSKAFGGTHRTEIDILRTLKSNTDLNNSIYRLEAWKFLEEIRARLNVVYNSDRSTSTYMDDVINVFGSFGYYIGYGGMLDYYVNNNFKYVTTSILQKKPVFIFGRTSNSGHFWVLDGYRKIINRYYYADYCFDEFGKFNAENKYMDEVITNEYIHVDYGWGANYLFWIQRGVYDFNGTNYDHRLTVLAGIQPKIN